MLTMNFVTNYLTKLYLKNYGSNIILQKTNLNINHILDPNFNIFY